MSTQITTADELAALPLGRTFTDRDGDVWMIDTHSPKTILIGPETGSFSAAHVLKKWGPLTPTGSVYEPGFPKERPDQLTPAQPTVEQVAEVLSVHRWKSMGVASVQCECGEILYGDSSLTQFTADQAFREHLARAFLALLPGRPESVVRAEGIRGACDEVAALLARQDADAPISIRVTDLLEALARREEASTPPGQQPQPWEHPGHKPTQHRDRKPPWCPECGWSSPIPAKPATHYHEIKAKP